MFRIEASLLDSSKLEIPGGVSQVCVQSGKASSPINLATTLDGLLEVSGSCSCLSIVFGLPYPFCGPFKRMRDFVPSLKLLMDPSLLSKESLGSSLGFVADFIASCVSLPS